MEKLIFGTFKVNNIEFAIDVKHIQEVVQSPGKFQEIPLSDNCLVGLFNLRDNTIPVVSIRRIFQFKEPDNPQEGRIVLLEHENMLVGVLVDSTEEIVSGVNEFVSEFLSRDNGPSVVKGVIQLSDQDRMIQIIDPLEVINFQTMPHMKQKLKILNHKHDLKDRCQCISFRVGELVSGLDIECIQEIIESRPIDTTALSGSVCLGAITLRRTSIPVINTKALFELEFDLEKVLEQAQH